MLKCQQYNGTSEQTTSVSKDAKHDSNFPEAHGSRPRAGKVVVLPYIAYKTSVSFCFYRDSAILNILLKCTDGWLLSIT